MCCCMMTLSMSVIVFIVWLSIMTDMVIGDVH